MIKKDVNFSQLVDFFKKNHIPTFDEDIDKYGGYFITAARVAAVVLAPTPLVALTNFCSGIDAGSLRVSKLLSWIPDKFKYDNKGREQFAIRRYELSAYISFMLLQIAIKNGVKEIIMPHLEIILGNVELSDEDKADIERKSTECDKERNNLVVPSFSSLSKEDITVQAYKIVDPVLSILSKNIEKCKETKSILKNVDISKIKELYIENITLNYQAYIINFSTEFPEFALWIDVTQKAKILKELKDSARKIMAKNKKIHTKFLTQTEKLIEKIEELKSKAFIKESGFPTFITTYNDMFKIQDKHLSTVLRGKILDNISAHQNQIKSELNKLLSDNTDVDQIVYPKNNDIYIAQSFESITYKKKEHKKGFLTSESLGERAEKGENIGNYLLQTLVNPLYATKPIILLGNPGAGKSMLSKMFAGLLCETNDFIPFLIKLRSVASSSASISEHINKGLANSIENPSDVNWMDWAKEFKERTPVIIMDGFDELMQTSNRELNGYVDSIRDFQEKALNSNICVRIILTSRVTVMQDVFIPDGTKIIKLDSFDNKRRDLWIAKWNAVQEKPKYKFAIPKNDKIELLAKEPLLMFMLAVYDFESSELQNMANDKTFNQSKLYDSLLNRFIKRQLEKNSIYKNATKKQKDREEELFRLRLGMIALMMFMNDTTSRDTLKLSEEMVAFGLNKSTMQADNILGGFFFIHENKSTTEGDLEKFNYEFLHKTFGEFLTADFMLRIAEKQFHRMINNNQEIIAKKETFNFCFGYNWLNKHYNIQNFLFEHAKQILKPDTHESKFVINTLIKTDLKELFDKGHQAFPDVDIRLLEKKSVIEHLGIYSQNLIFLWLAISDSNNNTQFEIFDVTENVIEPNKESKYDFQDRDETNKNKLHWKRLAKLWTLVGNNSSTAKLTEWINVIEVEDYIIMNREKSKVIHNFSDSAKVACNDFELLLSYFDNEYKFSNEQKTLATIETIVQKKAELTSLAIDVVLHRLHDLYSIEGFNVFEFFRNKDFSKRQQIVLIKKIGQLKWHIDPNKMIDIIQFISKHFNFFYSENSQATIEYLRILVEMKSYFPISQILDPERLDEMLHRLVKDIGYIDRENPMATLEHIQLLNELNKFYPFRRKFRVDYLEESLHRITRDIHHFIRESPYSAFEYLKLLNELRKFYPMGRKWHPEFYEETLHRLSHDIKHISRDNPHAVLEYLKLLNDLRKHHPFKNNFSRDFLHDTFRSIAAEWEYIFRDDHFNLIEYLKILVEFSNNFAIDEIIPPQLIRESFDRVFHDFIYIIRDNPKEANTYLAVLKQVYSLYPLKGRRNIKFLDEIIHRIGEEINFEMREHSHTILIYLELILMSNKADKDLISRVFEMFYRNKSSRKIILKAIVLLIEYGASQSLVHKLLQEFPKLNDLYVNSPDIARELIEAIAETDKYERRN